MSITGSGCKKTHPIAHYEIMRCGTPGFLVWPDDRALSVPVSSSDIVVKVFSAERCFDAARRVITVPIRLSATSA